MSFPALRVLAISLAAVAVSACDDDPTNPPQQTATVRVINAATGTANVAVLHGQSSTPLASLNFRAASECVDVPVGQQTLTFRAGNDTLAQASFTFEADERYTVIIADDLPGTDKLAEVFSDEVTPVAANNALRFINATATAGDVRIMAPGAATQLVHGNLGPFGVYTDPSLSHDFVQRSTNETEVRLYDVDETTDPRAELSLTGAIPTSRVATVVFFDAGTPAGATSLVVGCC
ncbi:MAG: DUF4397 domain-containing protein [Gemmatimonadota bacterium]|nr:DUF4397 domain-containing protein [Gemmatimonadota bacterium]